MRSIWKKILRLVLVVLAATALTFLMVNLLPGDASYMIGGQGATQEDIQAIREDLGLDRNIVIRYLIWLGHLVQGDLGKSYLTQEPVLEVILTRLPVTIELLVISQFLALLLALPAGLICAYRSGSLLDRLISISGFATLSIPSFVMALVAIYLFAIQLHWLPATGYWPISSGFGANIKGFVLPALSLALMEWVALMRVLRSDMISTLQQNFILMARAKGLPPWKVLLHHALRPSSFTLVTVLGLQMGRLIGGAVIIETIFALPGIGRLLVNAIYSRDYMVVQGCILLITIGYVFINTIVDLLYHILDPVFEWSRPVPDNAARARQGAAFWLPVIWIAAVMAAAATAGWWTIPAFDWMDWDNLHARPGTRTAKAVLQNGPELEKNDYAYWLGTDTMGRDVVSRLIYGARISLSVGLISPLIGFVIGGTLGCLAGYFRGRLESIIVAAMDVVLAFPALVLLLAITFYLGPSLRNLILALGFLTIPTFSRVARAKTLTLRDLEFVQAARLSGAGRLTILVREIVPNVITPMSAYGLLVVSFMIMAEGALSFLGLGVPAPIPSWGGMIAAGREVLEEAPHVSMIPAGVMFLTVISFNLIGDNLRDRAEKRLSRL